MFKIGSLFDGSGGFPLAASLCGGIPVWAAEVEPYPIAVTKSRFPGMEHLGNVCEVNGAEVEPVDVITFGSPCQDLSVAGKRAGIRHAENGDDETTRSGLFMEAVRIIKEMRKATNGVYPTFAIWENVPGAFSCNHGEDFRVVLEELVKVCAPHATVPAVAGGGWPYADCYMGDGWSLAYRVFDAQYWGVPQRRRRIYLVLDLGGQRAVKVLFERKGLRGHFETGRAPWKATAGDAESRPVTEGGAGKCIVLNDQGGNNMNFGNTVATLRAEAHHPPIVREKKLFENHSNDSRVTGPHRVCQTLSSRMGTGGNNLPLVCQPIPINDKATRWRGGGQTRNGDGAGNGLGVGKPGEPSPTLSTCDRHMVCYGIGNGQANQGWTPETLR